MERRSMRWRRRQPQQNCPAKTLLGHFSPPGDEMRAYRLYLTKSLNLNTSHTNLAEMEDSLLAKFYGPPETEPKYFSFFRPTDLALLEEALSVRLLIVRRAGNSRYARVHQRDIFDVISGDEEAQERVRHSFLLSVDDSKKWKLVFSNEIPTGFTARGAERSFISGASRPPAGCCWVGQATFLWGAKEHCCPSSNCLESLPDFLSGSQAWHGKRRVMIVSHLASVTLKNVSFHPKDQVFAILSFLRPDDEDDGGGTLGAKRAVVLCLTVDGSLYLPHKEFADSIINVVQSRGRQIASETFPDINLKIRRGKKDPPPPPPPPGAKLDCCDPCRNSVLYEKNMSPRGPARLLTSRCSSFDLMFSLGWDTEENVNLVRAASKLTCCFYDIESTSQDRNAPLGREDIAYPFFNLNDVSIPRQAEVSQHPVLIATMDGLDMREGVEPQFFRVTRENSIRQVVYAFVDHVYAKRLRAQEEKQALLQPLLSRIQRYKDAFLGFLESLPLTPEEEAFAAAAATDPKVGEYLMQRVATKKRNRLEQSWRKTLWGMLESQLNDLVYKYYVLAYNAEAVGDLLQLLFPSPCFSIPPVRPRLDFGTSHRSPQRRQEEPGPN
jgi:hypothetical protein